MMDDPHRHELREVRFSIEGEDEAESPGSPPAPRLQQSRTGRLIANEVRTEISREYVEESRMLMRSRRRWKKGGDLCEAISKGLAGISTVLAYAASAVNGQPATDILAFTSGFIGTIGLTLFTYSAYASQESRQRTFELNALLQGLGVTPMPEIASQESTSGPDA